MVHQRLGDLERVVAQLTQQARATPVPMQESPPKVASIAETATETSAAKASSQGTVPPGTHQPVGAPQVSSSQDASGVAASSQGNAFTSTIPDPPVVLFKVQDLVTMPQLIQGTLVGVQQVNIS